jgi:hypothetical protein
LIALEELEMIGLEGEEHEFDFIKHIFRCSPNMKRMTLKLSPEVWTGKHASTKISNICNEYPSVERCIHLSSGKYIFCILNSMLLNAKMI